MWRFDLRLVVVVVMNIVKSHVAMPWEWDPFHLTPHLTCLKFSLLVSLSFLFSFIFVGIPSPSPSPSPNAMTFRLQSNSFSPSLFTTFLACFFTPQSLFWYVCPLLLLSFLWYPCISHAFASSVLWIQAMLSAVPDLNISITRGDDDDEDEDDQLHGSDVDELV